MLQVGGGDYPQHYYMFYASWRRDSSDFRSHFFRRTHISHAVHFMHLQIQYGGRKLEVVISW